MRRRRLFVLRERMRSISATQVGLGKVQASMGIGTWAKTRHFVWFINIRSEEPDLSAVVVCQRHALVCILCSENAINWQQKAVPLSSGNRTKGRDSRARVKRRVVT